VDELMASVMEHRDFLALDGGKALDAARYVRIRQEFLELLKEGVFRHLLQQIQASGRLEEILQEIMARHTDPYSDSENLVLETLGPLG
jgi:putative protein kinase ArgK-like GTPase of G3E family